MIHRNERFHVVETWQAGLGRRGEWQAAPLVIVLQALVLPATAIPPTP